MTGPLTNPRPIYSYFERMSESGCRKRECTWQSRKVLWVVLSSSFLRIFERMAREVKARTYICECYKEKQQNSDRFDSTATVVRNSVLIISIQPSTFQDCRVYIFSDNLSRNSCFQCGTLVLVSRESFPWVKILSQCRYLTQSELRRSWSWQ